MPVLLGNSVEIVAQHIDLAGHGHLHYQLLLLIDNLLKIRSLPDESFIDFFKCLCTGGINEDTVDGVEKDITGGTEDRPVFGHPLPPDQDLFTHDIEGLILPVPGQEGFIEII